MSQEAPIPLTIFQPFDAALISHGWRAGTVIDRIYGWAVGDKHMPIHCYDRLQSNRSIRRSKEY
jgi:hypothetical protein